MKAKTILDAEKKDAIDIATELCYSEEVKRKIAQAKSVYEIGRILKQASAQSRVIFLKGEIMQIYIGERQSGKTTMLIEMSEKSGATIVVATYPMANYIQLLAAQMGKKIPVPITVANYIRLLTINRSSFDIHGREHHLKLVYKIFLTLAKAAA